VFDSVEVAWFAMKRRCLPLDAEETETTETESSCSSAETADRMCLRLAAAGVLLLTLEEPLEVCLPFEDEDESEEESLEEEESEEDESEEESSEESEEESSEESEEEFPAEDEDEEGDLLADDDIATAALATPE
jgi:hypothetical protein